jgi:hypothetical protein
MRSIRIGERIICCDVGLTTQGSRSSSFSALGFHNLVLGGQNFESDSGTGSVCSDYLEDVEVEKEVVKKLIKPDILAMSQLLNFDEVKLHNFQHPCKNRISRKMKMT